MEVKRNLIAERSFEFALSTVALYQDLVKQREYVLSKQLLRSGTSIGANVEEAIGGISKRDFTAKMSIALKEARESNYWLRLIEKSDLVTRDCSKELDESLQIVNILTKIVKTSQASL